ncbi:hypothetical protein AWH56_002095 [Anaerobacillus isosaccharinicus]|uniref:Uncharacterized protein n=1 Tax=Anaerobacillus isosaccharinicus TaxID=1532552 RepID=A0A7S7RC23_9BACI|nr:hypothetical protein [Anaerobacillus isosaccharinicus]
MIINSHFEKLDLLTKYSKHSTGIISTIERTLRRKLNRLDKNQIVLDLIDHAEGTAEIYGYNYWEVSLYQGLAKSEQFVNSLYD